MSNGFVKFFFTVLVLAGVLVSGLTINSLSLNESDFFYSPHPGNNVINLFANVSSDANLVQANFSGIAPACGLGGIINMTSNGTGNGLWNASCDVTSVANTSNFVGGALVVLAFNSTPGAFAGPSFQTAVLYNMTTPPDSLPCFKWGAGTTNMSQVLNFASVNLVLFHQLNGSAACNGGQQLPWGNTFKAIMVWNFSSVNLSTQAQAQKLAQLEDALDFTIPSRKTFGDARIFVNDTLFAELSQTTTLQIFDLIFASAPNFKKDNSTRLISGVTWTSAYNSLFNATTGNLTFTVNGFTGYNVTDNTTPTILILNISNATLTTNTTPLVNVTLNGTGSEISAALFYIDGSLVANYTNTSNTANCVNASLGSELWTCTFILNTLSVGNHALTVVAYDYGAASPGNNATNTSQFTIVGRPYYLALGVIPSTPAVYSSTQVYQFNSTWNGTISTVLLEWNASGTVVNYTATSVGSNAYRVNFTGLAAGAYSYKWHANDTLNNFNSTSLQTYQVLVANNTVRLYLNGSQANLTQTYNATLNVTAVSDFGTVQLFLNGALVSNPFNQTLGVGNYTFLANVSSTANFTAANASWNLTVTVAPAPLTLTLNGAESNLSITLGTNVTINASSAYGNVSLFVNGANVSIPYYTGSLSAGTYTILANVSTLNANFTNSNKSYTLTVAAPAPSGGAGSSGSTPASCVRDGICSDTCKLEGTDPDCVRPPQAEAQVARAVPPVEAPGQAKKPLEVRSATGPRKRVSVFINGQLVELSVGHAMQVLSDKDKPSGFVSKFTSSFKNEGSTVLKNFEIKQKLPIEIADFKGSDPKLYAEIDWHGKVPIRIEKGSIIAIWNVAELKPGAEVFFEYSVAKELSAAVLDAFSEPKLSSSTAQLPSSKPVEGKAAETMAGVAFPIAAAQQPFDWTAVVIVAIILVAAGVVYFFVSKKE